MILKMYCNNALVDEVPLNYTGLQTHLEHQWYEDYVKQELLEKHNQIKKETTFILEGAPALSSAPVNRCQVVQMLA